VGVADEGEEWARKRKRCWRGDVGEEAVGVGEVGDMAGEMAGAWAWVDKVDVDAEVGEAASEVGVGVGEETRRGGVEEEVGGAASKMSINVG